jgi:hypothetical protein
MNTAFFWKMIARILKVKESGAVQLKSKKQRCLRLRQCNQVDHLTNRRITTDQVFFIRYRL